MIFIEFKKIEEGIINIYEDAKNERMINARELHQALNSKRQFANWIRQRIVRYNFVKNFDYITFNNFVKRGDSNLGNRSTEYYVTIDMAKELCMVENNEIGRKIRRYFIETESRYRSLVNTNNYEFKILEDQIIKNSREIRNIKEMLDIKVLPNYCLASDIASQLNLYSENNLPHNLLINAIAKELGFKIGYRHYYEDENIVIIKDISNKGYQIYYKPAGVEKINEWFCKNKEETYYEIMYLKNTKNKRIGEVREKGYRINDICYKVL